MDKLIALIKNKEVYGVIIIIVVSFVVYKLFNILVNKSINRSKTPLERKRKQTVYNLIKNIIKYIVFAIAIIIILDLYGINVTSLVASLGVASAVGALALQDTLKDIINGTTIIMDNYYVVGDYVQYEDFFGEVIELGLKSTKIMDFDGRVLSVANRNINSIINLSQKTASVMVTIPTAYEEKTDKVEKVLKEVVKEIKNWETMDPEKTMYLGIVKLADSSVNYGIRFYCSPGKKYQYERDIYKLVKNKYEDNNIKIPYNQIEVHNAKQRN